MVANVQEKLLGIRPKCEDNDLWDYLQEVWKPWQDAVKRGDWNKGGVLPGPLNLRRKASTHYIRASGYKQSYTIARTGILCIGGKEENAEAMHRHCSYAWLVWMPAMRSTTFPKVVISVIRVSCAPCHSRDW